MYVLLCRGFIFSYFGTMQAKMLMLHDHAEELTKKISSHENVTNPDNFGNWSPEEQEEVHRISLTCDKVFLKWTSIDVL